VSDPWSAVAETHISTVFFAGERAYKLLKPLRTGFLDYSTPERRAEACTRELELNRRMAPDVYLGVSPIIENGVVTDHLIVMRRLPSDRRMSKLVRGPERDDAVRAVARAVAAFHAAQPPDERAALVATRDGVETLWRVLTEGQYVPKTHPSNIVLVIGFFVGAVVMGPWWDRSVSGVQDRIVVAVAVKLKG
jgi:aminoglycoside phosphotransferase family enzyme